MTLILAAQHEEGIAIVSDTLAYNLSGTYHTHKVRPIGNGKAIMGFAGEFHKDTPDEHFAKYSAALETSGNPRTSLEILQKLVKNNTITTIKPNDPLWYKSPVIDNGYVFGIRQNNNSPAILYVHDPSDRLFYLEQVPFHDMGVNVPGIKRILKGAYDQNGSIDSLISGMKEALEIGKEFTQREGEEERRIVQGTHVGVFMVDGYEVLEFSKK